MDISKEEALILQKYKIKVIVESIDNVLENLDFITRGLSPKTIFSRNNFNSMKNYEEWSNVVINSNYSDFEKVEQICKIIFGGREFDKNNPSELNFNDNACEEIKNIDEEDVEYFYSKIEEDMLKEIPIFKSIKRNDIIQYFVSVIKSIDFEPIKLLSYSKILDNAVSTSNIQTNLNEYVNTDELTQIAKKNDYFIVIYSNDYDVYLNCNYKILIVPKPNIQRLIYKKLLNNVEYI